MKLEIRRQYCNNG